MIETTNLRHQMRIWTCIELFGVPGPKYPVSKNHGNPFHQRKIYRFLIVFNVVNGGFKVLDQSDLRQRRPNQTWCIQRHEGFKSIPEAEIHFAIYGYFFVFSSVRMLLLIVSQ